MFRKIHKSHRYLIFTVTLILLFNRAPGFADEPVAESGNAPSMPAEIFSTDMIKRFSFPIGACTGNKIVIPDRSLNGSDIADFIRRFAQRKQCEDHLMVEDRLALDRLVERLGGIINAQDDQTHWEIPYQCECERQISALLDKLEQRDQSRITAYQNDYYRVAQAIRSQR